MLGFYQKLYYFMEANQFKHKNVHWGLFSDNIFYPLEIRMIMKDS